MKAKVYVPKEADHYTRVMMYLKGELAEQFGGFTTYEGRGGWINDNGDLIQEPVTVVESFGQSNEKSRSVVRSAAERVFEITNEDAIMYSIDNENYMITE